MYLLKTLTFLIQHKMTLFKQKII